jgi:hypothetical protein
MIYTDAVLLVWIPPCPGHANLSADVLQLMAAQNWRHEVHFFDLL